MQKYGIVKWPHLKYIAITDPSCICLLGFVSTTQLVVGWNFSFPKKREENKRTYFLEHLKFVLFSARLALKSSFQTSNVYLSEVEKYASAATATFFPFSTNDSFPIQKLKDRKDKSVVVVGFYARRLNKYQLTNLDSIHFLSLAKWLRSFPILLGFLSFLQNKDFLPRNWIHQQFYSD